MIETKSFHRSIKNNDDRIFAKVAEWALSQDEISCNQIMGCFGIGWNRAKSFIMRLHDLGIVDGLYARLPRKVLLHSVDELPQDVAELLQRCGSGLRSPTTIVPSHQSSFRVRTKKFSITNTAMTASGADELIVELNRRLIGLTDQHVITKCTINVEYKDPG